ncbi:hypothetical protein VQ042_01225 [Aurantimonas sp. A2-1-M11]|uniref:hypothetical protein n=1 Tax=Aurantimonas sp. A2-1-M11 TaxID=3113712 RepID=UPI002F9327E5
MRINHLERVASNPAKDVKALAVFDLELSDDCRIYGLRLMRAPDGRHLVYAPSGNGGRRLATFSTALAAEIAEIAASEMERASNSHGTYSRT